MSYSVLCQHGNVQQPLAVIGCSTRLDTALQLLVSSLLEEIEEQRKSAKTEEFTLLLYDGKRMIGHAMIGRMAPITHSIGGDVEFIRTVLQLIQPTH